MRIEARGASGGTLGYWVRSLAAQLTLGGHATDDHGAPSVVVRGESGREGVLLRTGTPGQARRAAARFTRELAELGANEFCAKYGLSSNLAE